MQHPYRSISDPGPRDGTPPTSSPRSPVSAPPSRGGGPPEEGPAAEGGAVPGAVSESLDRLLETVVRYKLVRSEASVSYWRVLQALHQGACRAGFSPRRVILTGSRYEGMPWEVCGDRDVMVTFPYYPTVLHQDPKVDSGDGVVNYNRTN